MSIPNNNENDDLPQVVDLPVLTQSLAALFHKKMEGRK